MARALLKGGAGVHRRTIRSRRVALNEQAREAIRICIASLNRIPAPDEFLFLSREGGNRPTDRTQAHRILKSLGRDCGIEAARVSTHSPRKMFVRSVYDASKHDLIRAQRIVDHSSPVITARYFESTQSELDDVVLGDGAVLAGLGTGSLAGISPAGSSVQRYAHYVVPEIVS